MDGFENLDDVIQHFGVKGMKWGRHKKGGEGNGYTRDNLKTDRKAINKQVRNKELTREQGLQARRDNVHKVRMNDPLYKKKYDKAISKGKSEKRAIRNAQRALTRRADFKAAAMVTAIGVGAKTAQVGYKLATTETAIRAGKNIILAAQGSNLRYASRSMIKNVVN